jgi:hypothetical protein
MITTSNQNLTRVHQREAFGDRTDRVSLIFYRTADFEKKYKKRGLFVAQLIKEGIPLYDRLGLLRQVLSGPFVPNVDISTEGAHFCSKPAPYKFPEHYNNNFLPPLAPALHRQGVMLALARRGIPNSTARPPFAALLPRTPIRPDKSRR